eukprot:5836280-Amphidinium_carterae.1
MPCYCEQKIALLCDSRPEPLQRAPEGQILPLSYGRHVYSGSAVHASGHTMNASHDLHAASEVNSSNNIITSQQGESDMR